VPENRKLFRGSGSSIPGGDQTRGFSSHPKKKKGRVNSCNLIAASRCQNLSRFNGKRGNLNITRGCGGATCLKNADPLSHGKTSAEGKSALWKGGNVSGERAQKPKTGGPILPCSKVSGVTTINRVRRGSPSIPEWRLCQRKKKHSTTPGGGGGTLPPKHCGPHILTRVVKVNKNQRREERSKPRGGGGASGRVETPRFHRGVTGGG